MIDQYVCEGVEIMERGDAISCDTCQAERNQHYAKAVKSFEQARRIALRMGWCNFNLYYNLGNLLRKMKSYDEAEEAFQIALKDSQHSAPLHYAYGLSLKSKADAWPPKADNSRQVKEKFYNRAIQEYDVAVSIDQNYKEALNNCGTAFVSLHALQKGQPNAEKQAQLFGSDPDVYLKKAIGRYERALQIDSEYLNAKWNKAAAFQQLNDECSISVSDEDKIEMKALLGRDPRQGNSASRMCTVSRCAIS